MKNQKGVTLIALVVTIIVLIILAGVAIAALTGQNGLITRSREAKVQQIRAEVNDRIVLALSNAKVTAEKLATENGSWFAMNNMSEGKAMYTAIMTDLLPNSDYTYNISDAATNGTSTSGTITFTNSAYQQAMNNSDAEIVYTITVTGNNFTYTKVNNPEALTD